MKWKKKLQQPQYALNSEKVFLTAIQPAKSVYSYLQTTRLGLTRAEVEDRQLTYGKNEVVHEQKKNPFIVFIKTFINPFIGVLTGLAVISLVIDVLMAEPGEQEWTGVVIIAVMVVCSAILRFWQEWKANEATDSLMKMVKNTCLVKRAGSGEEELDITELVPGDIVFLAAGDMIPADLRIIESKDLFISQASLTGESEPIEKFPEVKEKQYRKGSIVELDNICYMGSTVISGAAKGIVFETGNRTFLGTIARNLTGHRATTAFDRGISKVSLLLIRFMLVMVPFVFFINGFTKGDWFEAFIFAISVAVGLTPEMLPMIVTANLSKGALSMSKKKTIVKNLNAIQNFGAMNILCTDKTGTLTCDKIVLEKYINADGSNDESKRILRHAYFNSYFQTGLKNLMDKAILSHVKELKLEHLKDAYTKVDEIPFDFIRRRMSVVIEDKQGKRQIITKGAVEEMLSICSHTEFNGEVQSLTDKLKVKAQKISEEMNRKGMRVLAVAQKSYIEKVGNFSVSDEKEMVLIGFLAFLDPPKPSAAEAIKQLHEYGVEVKILSGDNDIVVKAIGRQVGIDTSYSLTGPDIENMDETILKERVKTTTCFSKLTPLQKTQIISILQEQKNTVGFLGDGINDAAALRQSDIGISVDSAVDIAKESADIILLEKDLMVLEDGVLEGRKTFGNINKYIKMTASSNFGNMFSVMFASAFLPFLPMMPIHLLIQNLLYDISQTTIPFDRMDPEFLRKPRKWDASDLKRFMIYIGPISSIFDIVTYLVMWHVFGCNSPEHQSLFQSGWFIEGLLSQTLIVHMIRTRKIPFIQSRATWPVIGMTTLVMVIGIVIPFTSFGASIGLQALPLSYFPWLVGILLSYCVLTQLVKNWYIRKFSGWL
ncbi:magnesium-translocating P-type ATPase [Bacteroides cellulosilyticus]|jgi:magnesium-importing ATPase|uniref:Magnesium-transporting ATPase, P-type 1 n=1 Tax=Bacteroides cellulosilyticus TaxID=246787 RepID=A0A5M6AD09_9BACE|nr:magnesium-translocating P-type ATPase [Bacteroides cellulosilyticus]KAA5410459.1 magnesium-translocating P-type ATPase [Bacteroides cellulosilyticus]RYU21381.1 magnesium-translocating P-type ATPase [Bacteroides cellulosilyticus]